MSADEPLVAEWLRELEHLIADLPVVQRRELLRDLEGHIQAELEERPAAGETELLEILERLGEPRAIAAAAYEEAGLGQTEGRAFAAAVLTAAAPERYSGRAVVITPPAAAPASAAVPAPAVPAAAAVPAPAVPAPVVGSRGSAKAVLWPPPEAYVPPAGGATPPNDKQKPHAPHSGRARGWARPSGFHAMLPPAPPPPVPPRKQATPWVVAAIAGGIFLVVVVLVGCFGGLMLAHNSSPAPADVVVPAAPMESAQVGPLPGLPDQPATDGLPDPPGAAATEAPTEEAGATVLPTPDETEQTSTD